MARCCDLGNRIEAITMSPELDKKSYGCKKYCCWNEGGGGAKPWNIRLAYLYLSVLDYEFEINDL